MNASASHSSAKAGAPSVRDGKSDPFDFSALGQVLNAADIGAFEWDRASGTVSLSEPLRRMMGAASNHIPGDWKSGFGAVMHPDDREAAVQALETGIEADGRYRLECRIVRPSDGSTFWASSTGVLLRSGEADPGRVVGLVQDITASRMLQEQREGLVAELDHRVKNVLSAVQSMAAQSARKALSLEAFLKTFSGRLKSMASAHALLTATRWRGASMGSIAAAELGGIAPGQTRWEGRT